MTTQAFRALVRNNLRDCPMKTSANASWTKATAW